MDMRDKTIKALEKAIQCFERYSGDEYGREYNYARVEVEVLEDTVTMLKEDARAIQFQSDRLNALLKAQEAVEPVYELGITRCGQCNHEIDKYGGDNYCPQCGKAVKWK